MTDRVDDYLRAHNEWADVLGPLRAILRATRLEETVKWGAPVYTLEGRNVVGLGAFKSYAGLWFFDGVLLEDPDGVLVNAQEGTTRALRQWRFGPGERVPEARVRAYVEEAIANARAGRTVEPRRKEGEVELPEELAAALAEDPELASAFEALTPGRQREYAEHIGGAKREATRRRRLDKARPMIARGEGLNDRYRK